MIKQDITPPRNFILGVSNMLFTSFPLLEEFFHPPNQPVQRWTQQDNSQDAEDQKFIPADSNEGLAGKRTQQERDQTAQEVSIHHLS